LKATIIKILKIVAPFAIGLYLVWFFYNNLTPEEKNELFWAVNNADYKWIFISLLFGWASHLSRAYRWRFLLSPLGYRPRYWNAYHSTMIGYILNLTIPRSGEVSRAAFLGQYEKIPVEKSLGTIIAERVIDLVMLGIVFCIALSLQYDKIMNIIQRESNTTTTGGGSNIILFVVIAMALLGIVGVMFILKKPAIKSKVIGFFRGLLNGLLTIFTMKKKWAFIGHTIFIWAMYVAMFSICFNALPQTTNVPFGGILAGFIAGTIGVIFTPGGLGVYPGLVAFAIVEYGVGKGEGQGLGWLIWASQNALIVVCGLVSLLLMPRYNRNNEQATTSQS